MCQRVLTNKGRSRYSYLMSISAYINTAKQKPSIHLTALFLSQQNPNGSSSPPAITYFVSQEELTKNGLANHSMFQATYLENLSRKVGREFDIQDQAFRTFIFVIGSLISLSVNKSKSQNIQDSTRLVLDFACKHIIGPLASVLSEAQKQDLALLLATTARTHCKQQKIPANTYDRVLETICRNTIGTTPPADPAMN